MRRGRIRMGRALGLAAALALGVALGSACDRGSSDHKGYLDELVIAEAGDYVITARQLDATVRQRFPDMAESFSAGTEQSIRNLLHQDLDALCLVIEAERSGYADTSAAYQAGMEAGRRRLLSRLFTEDVIDKRAGPTEDELREIYEVQKEQYRVTEKRVVRHVLVDTRKEAETALAQVQAGEPFTSVASRMTRDERSRVSGGSVGWVEPGQPVSGLGDLPEFVDAAMQMGLDEMRIIKSRLGWHLMTVIRVENAGYRSFEELRDQIYSVEHRKRVAAELQRTTDELRVRYGLRVHDENMAAYLASRRAPSEAELWAKTQEEGIDPSQKIALYEDYLGEFAHSEHACEAQFLIGFTYAEELKDRSKARVALNEFLKNCPESELAESAKFLMDELNRR